MFRYDNHDDALNSFNQAKAADPNNPTAVIAWRDMTPPNFTDLRIATPMLARPVVRHWPTSTLQDNHLGVGRNASHRVSHSYGSTNVPTRSPWGGMHANDVVLLGCLGTTTHSAAKHLDGGRGWPLTDPISMLARTASQYVNRGQNLAGSAVQGLAVGLAPTSLLATDSVSMRFRAEVPNSDGINPHRPLLLLPPGQ